MRIKDLAKESMPREKLISKGVDKLSNEELLAIIINTGTKEYSALELAYFILSKIENVGNLLSMSYQELSSIVGIKEKKATTILASLELARRAFSCQSIKVEMQDAKSVFKMIHPLTSHKVLENLYLLFLDTKLNLIQMEHLSEGNVNYVLVNQREVILKSLQLGASFLILAHNHPSGNVEPSKADIEETNKLKEALSYFDITLLDHVIIGEKDYFSLKENFYLE